VRELVCRFIEVVCEPDGVGDAINVLLRAGQKMPTARRTRTVITLYERLLFLGG
jgi:hypothetical protein